MECPASHTRLSQLAALPCCWRWCRYLLWICALGLPNWAHAAGDACSYQVRSAHAAKAVGEHGVRPTEGWVPVQLPEFWTQRWPGYSGSVWYRIEWERTCPADHALGGPPAGIGFNAIHMAGEVYLNDALLWRDASHADPLSHSWNVPRWWTLPASALRPGVNTVWVRVTAPAELAPGLDALQLGPAEAIEALHASSFWRKRTAYLLATALSAALGAIFLVVWLLRRREHSYGWFALMSFAWTLYTSTLLATAPWPIWPIIADGGGPFESSLRMSRLNVAAMVAYVLCFCMFTFRFSQQQVPRIERALWGWAALSIAIIVLVPRAQLEGASKLLALGCATIFFANCLQTVWCAWRRPQVQAILMALCWASFLVVGVHDLAVVFKGWNGHDSWAPLSAVFTTALVALLLGGRLAASMRNIEQFNVQLEQRVSIASAELAEALEREHAQRLEHTRLQERVQLAHDLHDGLGGSLVRSIAVVERAQRNREPLANERMLSLLKLLRDDLRQMIDHGSSVGATVPDTPEQWMAPLRYRFTRIFDEMNIAWEWHSDPTWHSATQRPSALQCLGLARILEEALTNAIKHSRASIIRVRCRQDGGGTLCLSVEDDGMGFDVSSAQDSSGLGVGMRSMAARARRIGSDLHVQSSPGTGCTVRVEVVVQCQNVPVITTHQEDTAS